jgi:hypothetical protein
LRNLALNYTINKPEPLQPCPAIIRKLSLPFPFHLPKRQRRANFSSTATLSCAASNPASQSAASATSVMANVPSATRTFARRPWCASATSARSATTRTSASCAAARAYRTRFIVLSARDWKRTGMGVRRLLTWEVRGQTYVSPASLLVALLRHILILMDGNSFKQLFYQKKTNRQAQY